MVKFLFFSVALNLGILSQAQSTSIPDANFEQALVNQGIDSDGMINGSILNSDAGSVTTLSIDNANINDLTGIAAFTALTSLSCNENNLTALDVSTNVNLQFLWCARNNLSSLDLSANTNLLNLSASENQLSSLNINGLALLRELYVTDNNLTGINTSTNPALEDYYCSSNQMTSIDIANNPSIQELYIWGNQLNGTLDISSLNQLESTSFFDNSFTGFLVGSNPLLTSLSAANNQLSSIDVSTLTALDEFICQGNQLTYLNVKNGNNVNFTTFNALLNPNLTCIEVDDPAYSTAATATWQKDAAASYSNNCGAVGVSEDNFTTENVRAYPNPSNGIFTVAFQKQGQYRIGVSDALGRTILPLKQSSNIQQQVDLRGYPKGIYFLQVGRGKQMVTTKVALR